MSRHANREAARRLRYIARNISSRAKMICLALREGGTAEFDDRRAGRGQGLARWIEISAGRSRALLADGSCCPAISLELRSLTTAAAALPQHHHHHPPRRILVQRPSTTPLPPVSGLLLSCDALSCSSPSPLRPPPHSPLRAPPPRRGSTRHARPGIVGTSRTYTHPLQEREPTTPHYIDSLSTVVSY